MAEWQHNGGASRDVSVGAQGQKPTKLDIVAPYTGNAR